MSGYNLPDNCSPQDIDDYYTFRCKECGREGDDCECQREEEENPEPIE